MHEDILRFIDTLVGHSEGAKAQLTRIFTMGNCGNFAHALSIAFPGGEVVVLQNRGHAVYRYDGRYFDVTGEVSVDDTAEDVDVIDSDDDFGVDNFG